MKRSLFCILLAVVLFLSGCGNSAAAPTVESLPPETLTETASGPERKFTVSATADEEVPFNIFSPEELGNNYQVELAYYELTDVMISVGTEAVPLEQAVKNGDVTIEALIAYARIDARNGICTEAHDTDNGLTRFVYEYPEYKVQVDYDILEAPDGQEHLINGFALLNTRLNHPASTDYYDLSEEYGYALDREDWGITLELVEATSGSITLLCTQAGGQHFGELQADSCMIFSEDWQHCLTSEGTADIPLEKFKLVQNGEPTFTIHWKESHGELPAGKYYFRIVFEDIYDAADLHPLMRNFNDRQHYIVSFEII